MPNQLKVSLRDLISTLPNAWLDILQPLFESLEFQQLIDFIEQRRTSGTTIYPEDPFYILRLLEPAQVRVVILGQDPYHRAGQAQGMAFSVPNDCKRPPSLRNILLEVGRTEGGDAKSMANHLTSWVAQGVLLLNTVLTVEEGQPASHAKMGWEKITDRVINVLSQSSPKVFMLWGAHAQGKQPLIHQPSNHQILIANHPSPLSANKAPIPFTGCGHFQQCNQWLLEQGELPIEWVT